jgi:hypothetical protein
MQKMQFSHHPAERDGYAWLKTAIPILVYRHAPAYIDQKEFSAKEIQRQLSHKRYALFNRLLVASISKSV